MEQQASTPVAFESEGKHFATRTNATLENSPFLRNIERRKAERQEMLEALEYVIHWHDQLNSADIQRLKVLVSKAKGERHE